jgi:hypothetical protein
MAGIQRLFGSSKGVVFLVVSLAATVLFALSKIDIATWRALVLGTAGAYIAGTAYEDGKKNDGGNGQKIINTTTLPPPPSTGVSIPAPTPTDELPVVTDADEVSR